MAAKTFGFTPLRVNQAADYSHPFSHLVNARVMVLGAWEILSTCIMSVHGNQHDIEPYSLVPRSSAQISVSCIKWEGGGLIPTLHRRRGNQSSIMGPYDGVGAVKEVSEYARGHGQSRLISQLRCKKARLGP